MAYEQTMFLQESINISVSDLCPVFCDPANKPGVCPSPCLSVCSSICHYSLSSFIPSHPYTPTTLTPSSSHRSTIFHKLFPFLIVTLAVLVTAFVLVCHYSIYVKFRSRRGRLRSVENHQMAPDVFIDEEIGPELDHPIWYIRTVGLQSSVINAITVCKYKKGDGLVEGTDCAVCLNEFEEDETLRLLPKCNHAFHIPCIDTWLRSHTNCPICRAGIVVNNVVISPSPQLNVDNLGISEETHEEILESDNQSDVESESPTERIQNLKEGVSAVLPMRRSVSMSSAPASMISLDLADMFSLQSDHYSEKQLASVSESNMGTSSKIPVGSQNLVKITGSSSLGRSSENGAGPMKRSLSCTGKLLLSKYSRSKNSTLPL